MNRLLNVILLSGLLALRSFAGGTFYVAPNGSDAGNGDIDHPFLTLTHARDAVRALNQLYVSYTPTNEPFGSGTNLISWWQPYAGIQTNAGVWTLPDIGGVNHYDLTNKGSASSWPTFDGTNIYFDGVSQYARSDNYVSGIPHEDVLLFASLTASNNASQVVFFCSTGALQGNAMFFQYTDHSWLMGDSTHNSQFMWPLTNAWMNLDFLFTSTTTTAWTNTVSAHLSGQSVSNSENGLRLGSLYNGTQFAGMALREMMVYSAPLSSDSKLAIYNYLQVAKGTQAPTSGFTIYLRGGTYFSDSSLSLTNVDGGGTTNFPVTWKAYPGETPRVICGRQLSTWTAVTDTNILAQLPTAATSNVVQADLSAFPALVTVTNYGYDHLSWNGWNELIFNHSPMTIAQYPNGTNWLYVAAPVTANTFTVTNLECYNWLTTNGVICQGYLHVDYGNYAETIVGLNSSTHVLTTSASVNPQEGQRFRFVNVLSELDQAGEYYIDQTAKIVYFWPPSAIGSAEVILTTSTNVLTCVNASNIKFSGITFEGSTTCMAYLSGCSGVTFDSCNLLNSSGYGLVSLTSPNCGIDHSYLYNLGRGPVYIDGGNRTNLLSYTNWVSYCVIHDYARWDQTYNPAVYIRGVGHYFGHNRVYNSTSQGVILAGNNHLVEYNELYLLCQGAADVGAIYSDQDWTQTGYTIRYNSIHDCQVTNGATGLASGVGPDVVGIYMDDCKSGIQIYGNQINRCNNGAEFGNGRDINFSNNVVINCARFGIQYDQRLYTWDAAQLNTLTNQLLAMPYTTPPWSTQDPWLLTYLTQPTQLSAALNSSITYCIDSNTAPSESTWIRWAQGAETNVVVSNCFTNQPGAGFFAIPLDQVGPFPKILNATTLTVSGTTVFR